MQNLAQFPGKYRSQSVGIVKGSKPVHLAPPFKNAPYLIKDLFLYLKDKKELTIIKSCVFRIMKWNLFILSWTGRQHGQVVADGYPDERIYSL